MTSTQQHQGITLKGSVATIVEFFDPACEACRAFHPIVKDIMAEHGDAVRVVIRYTPFHGAASEEAIRVLEAARKVHNCRYFSDAHLAQVCAALGGASERGGRFGWFCRDVERLQARGR